MRRRAAKAMELKEAIYHRRAVRSYTAQPVGREIINELLHAAVQAPSGLNQQPWAFGVFQGRQRLQRFSDRTKKYLMTSLHPFFEANPRSDIYEDPSYDVFHGAGTLIVIYATHGELNPAEDCCLAAQNLMLTAHGLGLGTCPIGFARPWLNLPETKNELDVPTDLTAVFPLVVGYPAGKPTTVPRKEPDVVAWLWQEQ